ncbi:MAG TPA: hypothetical protein VIS74_02980 [Chthoniobacterales bacterium]
MWVFATGANGGSGYFWAFFFVACVVVKTQARGEWVRSRIARRFGSTSLVYVGFKDISFGGAIENPTILRSPRGRVGAELRPHERAPMAAAMLQHAPAPNPAAAQSNAWKAAVWQNSFMVYVTYESRIGMQIVRVAEICDQMMALRFVAAINAAEALVQEDMTNRTRQRGAWD